MRNVHRSTLTAATIAAMAVLGLSACSNDSSTSASSSSEATTSAEATSSAPAMTSEAADPAANLIGTGCAAYAEQVPEGPGVCPHHDDLAAEVIRQRMRKIVYPVSFVPQIG